MLKKVLLLINVCIFIGAVQAQEKIYPGADENTPSRSQYFSWINNLNEGATEKQTSINLNFFKWLHDEYGMVLDIYAYDAGAIDGAKFYGSIYSDRFNVQFPNGFEPNYRQAKAMGTRLGIWGGPDGFGDTQAEEEARIKQMAKLCKDYEFALFKFDKVCGPLRLEKEDAFIRMMEACRSYSPDLILLNHRLGLKKSKPYATTFLWGGKETYIDVHLKNTTTAPHHRAGALERGLPPELKRLTEDHGVCISSCLDNWDDDLVLQAFNRNLILAPEIYGNPWLLRDDEFPILARIYNLHKQYRDIMQKAMILPETQYGLHAVSRGNETTRLLSLRNLSWEPMNYKVLLDTEIGLAKEGKVHVRKFHPRENVLGDFNYGEEITVTVEPFRSLLLLVSTDNIEEPAVEGCEYEMVRNLEGKPVEIKLLGEAGTKAKIKILGGNFNSVKLNGKSMNPLVQGKSMRVSFEGQKAELPYHRKIVELDSVEVPQDASVLYDATCFAADNNALEVRSLSRSGETNIPQVKAARDAFFNQKVFRDKGLWDQFLFDNDSTTTFFPSKRGGRDYRIKGGCFRLDLAKVTTIDKIVVECPDAFSLLPLEQEEGLFVEVSKDLKEWRKITCLARTKIVIPVNDDIRYLRMKSAPSRIDEVKGYKAGKQLSRKNWRASNLFAHPSKMKAKRAWAGSFIAEEVTDKSYLCVAVEGIHGVEGAYAALRIGNEIVGAPDRAVSYPSNAWESNVKNSDKNYTYYFPMKKEWEGKKIEVINLGYAQKQDVKKVVVWQTVYEKPTVKKTLMLN